MCVGVGGCALVLLVNSSLIQGEAAARQNELRALTFACRGQGRLSAAFRYLGGTEHSQNASTKSTNLSAISASRMSGNHCAHTGEAACVSIVCSLRGACELYSTTLARGLRARALLSVRRRASDAAIWPASRWSCSAAWGMGVARRGGGTSSGPDATHVTSK